jgi:hypothetical protein
MYELSSQPHAVEKTAAKVMHKFINISVIEDMTY